jgi:hypothetical protein
MNVPRRFETLSTAITLAVLAFGFACLGTLSLVRIHLEYAANGTFSESIYAIVASVTSILLGATFLLAAVAYFRTRSGKFP